MPEPTPLSVVLEPADGCHGDIDSWRAMKPTVGWLTAKFHPFSSSPARLFSKLVKSTIAILIKMGSLSCLSFLHIFFFYSHHFFLEPSRPIFFKFQYLHSSLDERPLKRKKHILIIRALSLAQQCCQIVRWRVANWKGKKKKYLTLRSPAQPGVLQEVNALFAIFIMPAVGGEYLAVAPDC